MFPGDVEEVHMCARRRLKVSRIAANVCPLVKEATHDARRQISLVVGVIRSQNDGSVLDELADLDIPPHIPAPTEWERLRGDF
jgi:hypothetical protein